MIDRVGAGFKEWAPLMLRLGLCTLFISEGARDLLDLNRSSNWFEIVTAVVELLGALFCLIGFMTRWAAAGLMILTIILIVQGPGINAFIRREHQLLFAGLVMTCTLYGLGGGKWSLDESKKKKEG
jgi:uncharacterized membrane protein YphA (DoxX/SURF4 family)